MSEEQREEFRALAFRHPWRPYQQRVLDAARLHLADRRLHVVSAPGSGKTTLGLEMFRQLGEPALVLAPTRIIRDQWIDKLREFLPAGTEWPPPWVSRSLDDLRLFTSITYQALHTRTRAVEQPEGDEHEAHEDESAAGGSAPDKQEVAAVIDSLKRAGVRTLILDEAHHLRAEWWKALRQIVDAIENMQVISLTATPPYDALGAEWTRYEELCGSIDEEISVPELVKAGTLCPHQDFLWTVVPNEREAEYIEKHAAAVAELLADLGRDEVFLRAIQAHPWLGATPDADAVLDDPETAMALLVFLKGRGLDMPAALMSLLDLSRDDVPAEDLKWWQCLLHAWLFDAPPAGEAAEFHELRKRLATRLRDRALLHQRQLQLVQSRLAKRYMTQSAAKIDACAQIHGHERRIRGDALRQVILADYIRDDHVQGVLGAWPIFCAVVRSQAESGDCALLTGRRVVVHAGLREKLGAELSRTLHEDPELPGFLRCDSPGAAWVPRLTELLEAGTLRCLVGTRALLGEGWDAPCINSLILASSVGAYVLTNQMRGRAIRIDRRDEHKVASIWHIVAVVLDRRALWQEMLAPGIQPIFWPGLADFRELEHRFETFVGVDHSRNVIENNVTRLDPPFMRRRIDAVTGAGYFELRPEYFASADALNRNNREMVRRLEQLPGVRDSWRAAIDQASIGRVVPSVRTDQPPRFQGFFWGATLYSVLSGALGLAILGAYLAAKVQAGPLWLIPTFALVFAAPKLLKAAWLSFRHLPIDGTLHQIGIALRDALCATRIIETSASRLKVTSSSSEGAVTIGLEGGTYHEQSLFADCMREIVGPVENPRYLIMRTDQRFRTQRKDYHAVPMRLGARKEDAQLFLEAWIRRVGPAELVYTRSAENRPVLLRARARAFANAMQRIAPRRFDRWQ